MSDSVGSAVPPAVPLSQVPGALEIRTVHFDTEACGRGVFALAPIARGALVENAHAILVAKAEHEQHLRHTVLEHYVYQTAGGDQLLALGIGSLFNHDDPPNVDFRVLAQCQRVEYYAARDIRAGEELCIYYGRGVWWRRADEESAAARLHAAAQEGDVLPFGADDDE